MEYAKLNNGIEMPMAGIGTFLLTPDEAQASVESALSCGYRLIDTANAYMNEKAVGRAMKASGLARGEIFLETKLWPAFYEQADAVERTLARLDTDYIDFYHMWGISLKTFVERLDTPDGPMARARKLRDAGVIRHISFSFHDAPENMIEIIRRGEGVFASVLCQYNLLDRANEDAIAYAHEQGLGVTIMGPVGGGRLGAPSKVIQDLLPGKVQSSAEMALRFVMNNRNVNIALSGMSSMDMVEENAAVASNMEPLTQEEEARIAASLEENRRLADLYCTGCNYCMPCPKGINIPEIFKMMNYHRVYGLTKFARDNYARIGKEPWLNFQNAAACVQCGACEKKCPQHLHIREQLRAAHEALGN